MHKFKVGDSVFVRSGFWSKRLMGLTGKTTHISPCALLFNYWVIFTNGERWVMSESDLYSHPYNLSLPNETNSTDDRRGLNLL
jgi:hypothetical protein